MNKGKTAEGRADENEGKKTLEFDANQPEVFHRLPGYSLNPHASGLHYISPKIHRDRMELSRAHPGNRVSCIRVRWILDSSNTGLMTFIISHHRKTFLREDPPLKCICATGEGLG